VGNEIPWTDRQGQSPFVWSVIGAIAARTELSQELPIPRHFEEASSVVTEEMIADVVPCGPDPARHLDALRPYLEAGFDELFVNQIGDDRGFFEFFNSEIRRKLAG
jgi:hypothetical protein